MKFARPVNFNTPRITQGFTRNHPAIDYGYPEGTPIYASQDGKVTTVVDHYINAWRSTPPLTNRDYGNYIIIEHANGFRTLYSHNLKASPIVKVHEQVKRGQKIAEVGNTGNSSGPHLHWELWLNGTRVNPTQHMDWEFVDYFVGGTSGLVAPANSEMLERLQDEVKSLEDALAKAKRDNTETKSALNLRIDNLTAALHQEQELASVRSDRIIILETELLSLRDLKTITGDPVSLEHAVGRILEEIKDKRVIGSRELQEKLLEYVKDKSFVEKIIAYVREALRI